MNDPSDWAARALPVILADNATAREEVIAAHVLAPNELDLLLGTTVTDFGGTRSMLSLTTPDEWRSVAALVMGLLDRSPLKDGHYSGERIILGTFANELAGYAASAERSDAAA